ncbi:MAG: flagellar protein FlgN [Candidatus Riflebacteria bacterium]|nr:flagellar protein FlgN [Candidatus Riflebacteria bacterium]
MNKAETLKNILEKELDLCSALFQFSEEKKRLLSGKEHDGLDVIVRRETEAVEELAKLDREREKLFSLFPGDPPLSFNDFLSQVDDLALKDSLSQIAAELKEVMRKIKENNRFNDKIATENAEFAKYMIGLAARVSERPTYGPDPVSGNKPQRTQTRSIFDRKV